MELENRLGRELLSYAERISQQKGWKLLNFLGAGATAAVFEVQAGTALLALKIYAPRFLKGRTGKLVRHRFDLVLKELMNHDCPHLIKIEDGGDIDGTVYMAMQRAPGKCLGDVLKQVPPGEIRQIVRQISSAAKYLEDRKLCHRDIKADNIVISDDFKSAVLLDLGVVRWLDEEGTAGTDQDGQLPFVATARYSSPEYMFRLMPAGPDLWRGLTFYQLGGILHDLIMKERLFEDVIQKSKENRYLIAHAVAARVPVIRHDGSVPLDLVLLAQRALEKDLTRRLATVDWEDFIGYGEQRQREVILGLRSGRTNTQSPAKSRVPDWIRKLEEALDRRLMEATIHCMHESRIISNDRAILNLSWPPRNTILPEGVEITVHIEVDEQDSMLIVNGRGTLCLEDGQLSTARTPIISVPVQDPEQYFSSVLDQSYDAFIRISAELVTMFSGSGHGPPVAS